MTIVVASLVERSIAALARSSEEAFTAGADVVEVRLDHLRGLERRPERLSDVRRAIDGPAIATLRSTREGGLAKGIGAQRAGFLEEVIDSGFEYVDLEVSADRRILEKAQSRKRGPKTIGSYHFKRPATKSDLRDRLERTCELADIGKVAAPCAHAGQAVTLADVGQEFKGKRRRFVLIGMGAQGQLTRVCARQIGSYMTYACLAGRQAAPGQLDVGQQSKLVRGSPVVMGLLGHPVGHSVSAQMQEAALESAGLGGKYLPLDLPPRAMTEETVRTLFRIGFTGLNVTIPHKTKAHRICARLGLSAAATGAVNTLSLKRGAIVGENTDLLGFKRVLEFEKVYTSGIETLIIGAGGAARAACKVLSDRGANVTVAARSQTRAEALAAKCGARPDSLAGISKGAGGFGVVVNATPIGTKGTALEGSSIPSVVFNGRPTFIDLVYNPPITRSMAVAKGRGCRTLGGLEMLVGQGAESFRLWTGVSPDVDAMRTAARRALG